MIPSPWVGVVLALGAFRLLRLLGWDDLPPIARARGWVMGESWQMMTPAQTEIAEYEHKPAEHPGKGGHGTPLQYPIYSRPLLAHFIHCPWCLGWWVSLTVYVAWLLEPSWTVYAAAPFALSATLGLIAKNLDP